MKKFTFLLILLLGSSIVFGQQPVTKESKGIFYRTPRFAGSGQDFIIGSLTPDTVFVKLKNGTYHELLINDFRQWEFIGGTLKITANQKLKIGSGEVYYIHCFLKASFPADKGCFELVDEQKALTEIKKLKVCGK